MKIQCLPRKWFEAIKGTAREMEVLAQKKVVSIQSHSGWDSEPPFSEEGLQSPNHLCLTFDDVTDYSDLDDCGGVGSRRSTSDGVVAEQPFYGKVARFRPVMAQKILKHVGHGTWPVLIHCTEGVSRSDPDITVSIRLMPKGGKLEVAMGRGQWPEEFPHGKLDWHRLRPLVTVDGGRRWRHRYAVSGLRDAAEVWLLHRNGEMPSIRNIFGDRET